MDKLIIHIEAIEQEDKDYNFGRFYLEHYLNEEFVNDIINFEGEVDKMFIDLKDVDHSLINKFDKFKHFLQEKNNRNFDFEFNLYGNFIEILDIFYEYLNTLEIQFTYTVKKINFIRSNLLCVSFALFTKYNFSSILSTIMKEEDINIKVINFEITFVGCSFENEPIWLTRRGLFYPRKTSAFNYIGGGARLFFPFFKDLTFNKKVTFYNCYFGEAINELVENKETKNDKIYTKAKFDLSNCVFEEEVSFDESTFYVKTLFHKTEFKKKVSFKNTKFIKLVDFYEAKFTKNTVFYKTDFEQKVVFVETIFKENVLFTYSTIHKMILRQTKFKKGFDFSLCSSIEALQIFNIELDDDNFIPNPIEEIIKEEEAEEIIKAEVAEEIIKEEEAEERMIKNVNIPLKHKIETYRIFKQQLNKADNFLYALEFKKLELKTYSKQEKLTYFEKFILFTSKWSNDFDNNFLRAILVLLGINLLFTYLTLINTDEFNFSFSISWNAFCQSIKFYLFNLNPIRLINQELKGLNNGFYILDFLGRIINGYLIYQIIQAFRKYRNK